MDDIDLTALLDLAGIWERHAENLDSVIDEVLDTDAEVNVSRPAASRDAYLARAKALRAVVEVGR